jgi:hypothetical protein
MTLSKDLTNQFILKSKSRWLRFLFATESLTAEQTLIHDASTVKAVVLKTRMK